MASINLNEVVNGVVLNKSCSIKADGDSTESKTINLRVKFDGVTLDGVFQKAVAQTVIQWQNGPGRKKFDEWTNGQTVTIEFKSPGRTQVDPASSMVSLWAKMTADERESFMELDQAEQLELLNEVSKR